MALGRVCVGGGRQSREELRVCRDRPKQCPHLPPTNARCSARLPAHDRTHAPSQGRPCSSGATHPPHVPPLRCYDRPFAGPRWTADRSWRYGVRVGGGCGVGHGCVALWPWRWQLRHVPFRQVIPAGRRAVCHRECHRSAPGWHVPHGQQSGPPHAGACKILDDAAHCAATGAVGSLVDQCGWWAGPRAC